MIYIKLHGLWLNNLNVKLGKKKGFIIEEDDDEELPIKNKTNFYFPDDVWNNIKQYLLPENKCSMENCFYTSKKQYALALNPFFQFDKSLPMIVKQYLCETCLYYQSYPECKGCCKNKPVSKLTFKYVGLYCSPCIEDDMPLINMLDFESVNEFN